MRLQLALVLFQLTLAAALSGSLYTYANYNNTPGLYVIDPATGQARLQCNLKAQNLPPLSSAAGAVDPTTGRLFFYSDVGVIELHTIQPSNCNVTTLKVTNLAFGQNNIYDIKYDRTGPQGQPIIYAVVSDPNCIHSSLDSVNPTTGAASSAIANVIAGNGLQSASGFDPAHGLYYYVSFVFPAAKPTACNAPLTGDLSFVLNVITLATGNVVAIPLTNNSIGVGEITTTLGYMQTPRILVGAGSPINATVGCNPGCFFSVNATTASVTTLLQLPFANFVAAEIDQADGLLFTVALDNANAGHLLTFSPTTRKLISSVPCPICAKLTSLLYM